VTKNGKEVEYGRKKKRRKARLIYLTSSQLFESSREKSTAGVRA